VSDTTPAPVKGPRVTAYWVLRVMESALLLVALGGIGLFAWSIVDIVRIETAVSPIVDLPASAWPGIFTFFGSMVLLQVVRAVLHRYRREDGTPRDDARGAAAAATAQALASSGEASSAELGMQSDT
jgi:TRAP-type C4-dicarboxylate transport system permease small subunit